MWFKNTNIDVQGTYTSEFAALARTFANIQPQQLGGSALAVYHRGEKVVDIWTGTLKQDASSFETQAWQQDSMALSFSTGKAALATLVHRLADQGLLDYDRPLAVDWPEFAQQGKANITLRHILAHQSGLYDIRNTIQSAAQMLDWQAMLTAFEQATPRFAAGSATAYQALSFGWLLGGLIEKVTGQTLAEVFNRELVQPLQLDGAYFGVPVDQLDRVARPMMTLKAVANNVSSPKKQPLLLANGKRPLSTQEKLLKLTGLNPYDAEDALMPKGISRFSLFTDRALQASIPAANGVFTARSLAKMYAMLANNGAIDGQQYLSTDRMRQLSQVQNKQRDKIMPFPMHWRLGYHRVVSLTKRAPQGLAHIGYNGSGAWCDPARELSFAYVHNFAGSNVAGDYRLWWLTDVTLRAVKTR
jgi:CubicO group peptidase (beta-lactamase class C family)